MKQTSIEWLESQLTEYLQRMYKFEINQAKEMHKKEIIEAVTFGQNNHTVMIQADLEIAEQYYAETYGK
jgi:hypothetical protein